MTDLENIDLQIARLKAARDALVAEGVENPHASALDPVTAAFVSAMIGMQHMPDNEATKLRLENLARNEREYMERYWNGNVPLAGLGEADAAYLAHMAGPFKLKTGNDIRFAGVIGGFTPQINEFRAWGEAWVNNHDHAAYNGPLKAVIAAMMGE